VVERDGDRIGIVMADQRMPGRKGVDLLGELRRTRPTVVRILTTAYADIESAIEAVNSGAIYKYVVKPWNPRDLRGTLLRAMEFFLVQRERNLLFREKLSVLQRLVIIDRVRSLAALAAGLSHHVRNSMSALKFFLDEFTPDRLRMPASPETFGDMRVLENLHSMAVIESEKILRMVERVAQTVVEPSYRFADEADVMHLIRAGADRASARTGYPGKVTVDAVTGFPRLKVDGEMVIRLFEVLINRLGRSGAVAVSAKNGATVWGTPGIQVFVSGEGEPWSEEDAAALFTPFAYGKEDPTETGLDLLAAFFIAYHHGGDLIIHRTAPNGPGFEVRLPFSPEASRRPEAEDGLLEKLLTRFDLWDSLA
jgi:two-component system probable response regulator PhcQ